MLVASSRFIRPISPGGHTALTRERIVRIQPAALYRAWTQEWDRWFTTPGSVLMRAAGVDEPFFFAVEFEAQVYPHYGRFLRLEPDRTVEFTWLTLGTKGAETVVTVELAPNEAGTLLGLTHAGFPDEDR